MQKPPRGTRELDFYKRIFDKDCVDKDILQLQQFMPGFYGVSQFEEYPEGISLYIYISLWNSLITKSDLQTLFENEQINKIEISRV